MATAYSSTISRYNGNGTTTEFSIGFPFSEQSDVKVYVKRVDGKQTLISSADYSFVGTTSIVFPASGSTQAVLAAGDVIAIQRETDFSSEYVFENQRRLEPVEVMNADDKEMRLLQELKRDVKSAIRVQPTSNIDTDEYFVAVEAVYENLDTIDSVASISSDITTCSTNINAIVDAPNQASAAAASAAAALASQNEASTSATNASQSAVAALASQNAASTSASAAASSATQASEAAKSGHVPGEIVAMLCTEDYVPFGMLPCDGQEYNSTTFPDLWSIFLTATTNLIPVCTYTEYASSITTYGQCVKFAVDTTNNKFKTPKIKDGAYLTQAMTNTEIGKSYSESLPNITGSTGISTPNNTSFSGAFKPGVSKTVASLSEQATASVLDFDASSSSSTYQDGAKVQGDNVRVRFFVVVANGAVGDSQVAWSQFVTSLSGRANTDLSNITSTGKETAVGWGMPDYSATISGVGNNYTAPCDGIFWFSIAHNNSVRSIYINDVIYADVFNSYGADGGDWVKLNKGDNIYITNKTTLLKYSYFIPLKGVNNA